MEKYDYYKAVKDDVENYINDNVDIKDFSSREELEGKLNEDLWAADSVTGNGSGSYTFSSWQAEENICHNLDLLAEACDAYCEDGFDILKRGAEAADVTIRCYLLDGAISDVLDEMDLDFDEDDEDNENSED